MAQVAPFPIFKGWDNNGNPLPSGKLFTYIAGTTTPQATYTDSTLGTPNTNPVILNSRGEAQVWLDPTKSYKFLLQDQNGVQIPGWPVDNINNFASLPTNYVTDAMLATSSQIYAIDQTYNRTAAEISAGVTPTNYGYAPGVVDRYGTNTTPGTTDMTAAISSACASNTVVQYLEASNYLVSSQIQVAAGVIMLGNGATITASAAWSATGWHIFNAKGSLQVDNLNVTVAAVARNTSWKAFNCDNAVQALPAGTRLVIRDCVLTNIDIGAYCDGGASRNVAYAEASGCSITINTLGTAGAGSVRPTCNFNNAQVVVIKNNPLLDASDRVNDVNNIYCIGSSRVEVTGNYIYSGILKVVSSATNGVDLATFTGNRIRGITTLLIAADTNPVRAADITDNFFDTPVAGSSTGVIQVGSYTAATVSGDSIDHVSIKGNTFRNVPANVYYISLTATNSIGCVDLEGNRYYNTSTASSGASSIINYNVAGSAYRTLLAANEDILGNSNTRSYLSGGNPFATTLLTNINEVGLNGTRNGYSQGSFTATLTGCTTSPTGTVNYTIRDAVVVLNFPSISATSNSTAATLTGLPAALQPATQTCVVPIAGQDNTAYVAPGVATASIATGSGTITLLKNGSTTGWTAAGTKGVYASCITYLLT